MIGRTYRNKHNGRIITISDSEVTDDGMILFTCDDGSYTTPRQLKTHWDEITEEE